MEITLRSPVSFVSPCFLKLNLSTAHKSGQIVKSIILYIAPQFACHTG